MKPTSQKPNTPHLSTPLNLNLLPKPKPHTTTKSTTSSNSNWSTATNDSKSSVSSDSFSNSNSNFKYGEEEEAREDTEDENEENREREREIDQMIEDIICEEGEDVDCDFDDDNEDKVDGQVKVNPQSKCMYEQYNIVDETNPTCVICIPPCEQEGGGETESIGVGAIGGIGVTVGVESSKPTLTQCTPPPPPLTSLPDSGLLLPVPAVEEGEEAFDFAAFDFLDDDDDVDDDNKDDNDDGVAVNEDSTLKPTSTMNVLDPVVESVTNGKSEDEDDEEGKEG